MSLARMSAGAGYRYLLRHTACGDACRELGADLTAYYTASGNPPGRWHGTGLKGLDAGRGLAAGTNVTEEAMGRLFGTGNDPVGGQRMGRPFPALRPVAERVAQRVARLPDTLAGPDRAAAIAQIEESEKARPTRSAVAGFDLTFTVPKSASVLWAIGDGSVRQAVADAHTGALNATLGLLEERFLHTRVGKHSCAQVKTRGLIAAAFDHWDTRTGDPNLHTHVVVSNKVQGPDGLWRTLDSRALHQAANALSEVYDDLLADLLAARLPLTWSLRSRGARRSPAFEIDGVPDSLLAAFSGRSAQIEAAMPALLTEFRRERGREPHRREVLHLRQRATLSTRPAKTIRSLRELRQRWQATATAATAATGADVGDAVTGAIGQRRFRQRMRADQVPPELLDSLAELTVAGAQGRRATWTRPNLLAEAARATRTIRMRTPADRIALLDRVVDAAIAECVALDPPEMFTTPARFTRPDHTSVFTRPDEHAYTTREILDAETRLLAATEATGAPVVTHGVVAAILADTVGARGSLTGRRLSADQQAAVAVIATSGRRLDVLVGPAGTGKTRALHALRLAWEATYGPGTVIGLAPSATAAAELGHALAVPAETVAKWRHNVVSTNDTTRARSVLKAGQLVIVDEAAMVSTPDLDALLTHATAAGAKLVLAGDHHQLGAVGAGGAFALLADTDHALHLDALWRFTHRWEAHATRALRTGDAVALDAYADHGRLHDGPAEVMLDAAYTAWMADLAAGHTAVLLAPDRHTVAALNTRAQRERIAATLVEAAGAAIAEDAVAGRGDIVVTRRNNRRLHLDQDRYVRNGDLWSVTAIHPDGALDAIPLPRPGSEQVAGAAAPVRLPADYVREHVELGYAATIHRAQGMTVDRAHVLTGPGMTRQALYVAMTRGRDANHAYVALDAPSVTCPDTGMPSEPTGRQVMEQILATDGAELPATATLRQRQNEATSPDRLLPIRETLRSASARALAASQSEAGRPDRAEHELAVDQIDALIRLRRATARQQSARPFYSPPTTNASRHDGISR